jgi:endo-1,4-beta-xylanase
LANRYADIFKVFVKNKGKVQRVTFWGVSDNQSWLNNWPVKGRTNYPLLFNRKYQPKPAFYSVIKVGLGI